ncbi:hypothetical protein GQ651_09100 [Alphaproteobacteria bacterium GH1-50]|uniref:Uncharacterized protein n=1 Tax=Kangsaoukella pontilimi TaxID=2691042 RepID=A0A7C9J387_9RHOB|nr:hypothetical protein [Kangsaoukella pontilimi]MXQ08001.1 hypothetical protein [Kangsaoukella pontilimi]
MLRASALVLSLTALAACSGWPDVPQVEGAAERTAWPTLLPLDQVAGAQVVDDPDALRETLLVRALALRGRAAILRGTVRDEDDMEALRQRLAR